MNLAVDQTKSPCECCRNSYYHDRGCCVLAPVDNLPKWVDGGDWDGKHWYWCGSFANGVLYAEKYAKDNALVEEIYQSGVERGKAIRNREN